MDYRSTMGINTRKPNTDGHTLREENLSVQEINSNVKKGTVGGSKKNKNKLPTEENCPYITKIRR